MKSVSKILAMALSVLTLAGGILLTDASDVAAKSKKDDKQTVANAEQNGYLFKSVIYNYTINCPQKPIGSIPAKLFFNDNSKKGEVIIFETFGNNIYDVKTAWVVLLDAFDDKSIPDLNTIDEKATEELLRKIQSNNGYVAIGLVPISKDNTGIYAVTSKEIEIDTDGDGTPDTAATTDRQVAVTFFRGKFGGRFCVQLIDNPNLRTESVENYKIGVGSLKETELAW